MSFSTLALVLVLGLAGPLLSWRTAWHIPVVLGELVAGIVFGATGFGVLHPSDPTFTFLADMGFALVMFVAGTHVPVGQPAVRGALGVGALRAVLVGVAATGAGFGLAAWFGTGHGALYSVLIASSSAALVLPIIDAQGLRGRPVLELTAQVAIADTACVVALPLVIDTGAAGRAALGAAAVAGAAAVLWYLLRALERSGVRRRVHKISEDRRFALELRVSLAVLFGLAALATRTHVSIMLAGFAAGLAVAGVGEPRRVARQLFAITDGFLAPLFFVWLGARLNLREFEQQPRLILLGLALGIAAVLAHALMRILGQPITLATLAAAQIGVPVAAVTVGAQLRVLEPGEGAALMLGALVTIAASAASVALAARGKGRDDSARSTTL
ncbi:Kef-type K+ transport system membrane component KefB [Nocardia transvalensis]|uniref:Kef-type K+ transport system membrane component KefB n=1 Tax=Nocardia transvalensis TaxID=37333 RepID=A0A7W9UHY7_9NOCA|nr:cation:proton antiporter [Nocardia transvalensis]MBB5913878.1 Kef-type K+ transport system membrane component KefB [Nocardia transvalensis]